MSKSHVRLRRTAAVAAIVLLSGLLVAQTPGGVPGDPLPGVTPVEFEEFRLGLDDFLEVETSEEGLGPAFNGTSCAACHNVPAVGGTGHDRRSARRPSAVRAASSWRSIASGETLFHLFSVPSHCCQPSIPADANVFARRVPIPLFGAGLVEAIPDETLLALEDPVDRNRDGVSGRAAIVVDVATGERRVGRFGWKAQHATLLAFGADAYRNEMGITNDLFPQELAVGVSARSDARVRSDPGSRRHPRSADRAARHRQLRQLHEVPGAGRARADRRIGASRRAGVRRHRLRRVPHAVAADRAERAIRSSITPGAALLGSAAARRRHRRRHRAGRGRSRTRFARRRSGAFASDGRCCTTGRRPHSRKRSAVTRTRRSWRGADSSARPKAIAPRCSRSSGLFRNGQQAEAPDQTRVRPATCASGSRLP